MYPDFVDLLCVLNDHEVRYVIVGGWAVSYHAQPRATKDLDILVGTDTANLRALYSALAAFGAPLGELTPEDFLEPGSYFRMGHPPVMVDILPEIDGIGFEDAWTRRVEVAVGADATLMVPMISADDLIMAKRSAGRPQDLADVAALMRARRP